MVLATPRLWVWLPGNACFWTEECCNCFYPYNESHWGPNKHRIPLYIKKLKHSSKYLLFLFYRRMFYKFEVKFPFLGEPSLQEKQWNNDFHSVWELDICLHSVSFPNLSQKMKGCKRRGTFGWLLWRHVSLSLRDESTLSFLSRQKTRTFHQHVSFPHLPYLTQQCFCLPPFVPGLTTAETHCTALWSFTREPACAFLPKENTQELQILHICTI